MHKALGSIPSTILKNKKRKKGREEGREGKNLLQLLAQVELIPRPSTYFPLCNTGISFVCL
jgi:hypothetical protein